MTAKQTWALIGAAWAIAISLFMIGLQRYEVHPGMPATVDKWTGTIVLNKSIDYRIIQRGKYEAERKGLTAEQIKALDKKQGWEEF